MENFAFPNCGRYFKKDFDRLRHKFIGAEDIENNFSQDLPRLVCSEHSGW